MTTIYIFFFILLLILLILVSINIVINSISRKQINGGVESLPPEAITTPAAITTTAAITTPAAPPDEILPIPDSSDLPIFSDTSQIIRPSNDDSNIEDFSPMYPSIVDKTDPKKLKDKPYDDIVSEIIAKAISMESTYRTTTKRTNRISDPYGILLQTFGISNVYKNKCLNLILHKAAKENKCNTILELEADSGLLTEQLIRYAKYKNINIDIKIASYGWTYQKGVIMAYPGTIQNLDMKDAVKSHDVKWRAQGCIFLMLQLRGDVRKLLDDLLDLLNSEYAGLKVVFCVCTTENNIKKEAHLAIFKKFAKYNFEKLVYSNHIFGEYVFLGGGFGFVNSKIVFFTREANRPAIIKKSMCCIS
jgi:hypothetical protein